MTIVFHKNFKKQYKKLTKGEKQRFCFRLAVFESNPFNIILNNHPLRGKFDGYRSINIAGDLRAIYKLVDREEYVFVAIDTHDHLYK